MKIDTDILELLEGCAVSGCNLVLPAQLDRKTYERVNRVLEAAGGKWNRKAKAHVFEADAAERVGQMIETGSVDLPRDEFNFFPTPPELVEQAGGCIEPLPDEAFKASGTLARTVLVHLPAAA